MPPLKSEPQTVRARMDNELKARVEEVRSRLGLSQQQFLERLTAWFLDQPQLIQLYVSGQLTDAKDLRDVSELLLKRMATKPRPK